MTIEDEFADWMHQVSVETLQGEGAWGETLAPAVSVLAFWQFENRVVISSGGKTITSSTQIYADDRHRAVFTEGSKVTLPGDPRQYHVVSVRTWPGDDSHLEVMLT